MERRHLRAIITVSFGKSEHTNYEELLKTKAWGKTVGSLKGDECIMLVATMQNQLMFLKGYFDISENDETKRWKLLLSNKVRIIRGDGLCNNWEPKMLSNYAKKAGIELIGIKMLEEFYSNLLEEKEKARLLKRQAA